jgi:hypothetical protein
MEKKIFCFTGCFSLLIIAVTLLSWQQRGKPEREFYQLTIYHYNNSEQEKILDNYLKTAFIPALHKMKISSVGIFKAITNDTSDSKLLYVLTPLKSLTVITDITLNLEKDKDYQSAGAAYIKSPHTASAYTRIETILLKAFPLAPKMQLPKLNAPKSDRIYELRSYESATEKIFKNKVKMFNEGDELGIFARLNFNPVFYAEVIAGNKMPNLMYMTSFENMADRDAHWKSFGADPHWKEISILPEYQNNVSHIDITFLRAAVYSDY